MRIAFLLLAFFLSMNRLSWAVPTFVNGNFSAGLTGWSYLGTAPTTGSTGGVSYALVSDSGPGVTLSDVDVALGTGIPGTGYFQSFAGSIPDNVTVLYQSIGGTYGPGDLVPIGLAALANDLNVFTVNDPLFFLGLIEYGTPPPTVFFTGGPLDAADFVPNFFTSDPYAFITTPFSFPIPLGSSNPYTLFVMVARSAPSTAGTDDTALLFTVLTPVPELDPSSASLPVALLLGLLLLLADRRRLLVGRVG